MEILSGNWFGTKNTVGHLHHRFEFLAAGIFEAILPGGVLQQRTLLVIARHKGIIDIANRYTRMNGAPRHVSDMDSVKESRNDKRFGHEATILIEDIPQGTYYHGKMVNYSEKGMSFESQVGHEPGAPIIFSIEDSPYSECPGVYHGQIKWCRQLPETASLYSFGVGVEYFNPDFLLTLRGISRTVLPHRPYPSPGGDTAQIRNRQIGIEEAQEIPAQMRQKKRIHAEDHRKHTRRSFDRPVLYATRNRFFKGTIKDISKGGVFIEAPDMMAVGQHLTLAIPSGGQGRGLKLKGKIVRIDPNGLAIRFRSVIKN